MSKIKDFFTRNIALKLISIFLAALLWVIIMNVDDPYITKTIDNIPVMHLNENAIDENNKLFDVESGETISVKVRGPRSVIDLLKASNFRATADFKQMSIVNAIPIEVSLLNSVKYDTSDVDIVSKSPEMLTLSLEDTDEKGFPINVVTTGTIPEGYYIAARVVNPGNVYVRGSKKQIAKINQIEVRINVSGATDTIQRSATLYAYDENNMPVDSSKIEFSANDVEVQITILPIKTIKLAPNKVGVPYEGYECTNLKVNPEEITIAGSQEDLDKISSLGFDCEITDLKKSQIIDYNISEILQERYPDCNFIIVDDKTPKTVTAEVTIEKLISREFWYYASEITFRNVISGLRAKFINLNEFKITVQGREEVVEELTKESLILYIDLKEYEIGTHFIKMDVETKEDIKVFTPTVSVEVFELYSEDDS